MPGGWRDRDEVPARLRAEPFRTADAADLGVSPTELQAARFARVVHGAYVANSRVDRLEVRAKAASLVLPPSAQFSHETAAELLNLPCRRVPHLVVSVPEGVERPQFDAVEAHECIDMEPGIVLGGIHVVQPHRLFLQMSTRLDLVELVVLGDAMVRRGLVTPDRLVAVTRATHRRRGVVLARRAAKLVRERVDSPQETRTRMLFLLGGLPEPEINIDVYDDAGEWIGRPDMLYRRWRVGVEYDGDDHRLDKKQWRDDIGRREVLWAHNWRLIVLTADDLALRPAATLHRVRTILVEAGCEAARGEGSPLWRDFFGPRRPRRA